MGYMMILIALFGTCANETIQAIFVVCAWIIYLTLSILAATAQTKKRFYIVYNILALLIVVNLAGCSIFMFAK